jgi:hypothetical protein
MRLNCPACQTPLRAKDVNLQLALATCHACGEVHDLSARPASSPGKVVSLNAPRPRIKLPKHIKLKTSDVGMGISWRWLNPKFFILAFFCLMWNGFLVGWYGLAADAENTPLIVLVFPLLHVAVGVGLAYYTLAGFINRTRIEVSRDLLTIRHGPLPWPGNQTLNGRHLKQLYVEESVRTNKGNTTVSYLVMALDRRDHKVKLLSDLDDKNDALFLEQELERHLGIEDSPVRGALEA